MKQKTIALLLLLCTLFTACAKVETGETPEKVTLVLDWTPNTNHTGFYVADALGYYAEQGIEISIVQPPEDGAYGLVASGKAQFCIGSQEYLAAPLTADPPLAVTAVAAIIDHNTSGLISARDKNITDFKALEGHNYASWGTPLEEQVIGAVMEKQGGDAGKLEFIPSTVTDVMTALSGNIDTVWVYEGWDVVAAQVAGFAYNYLDFKDVLPVLDFYTPVLAAGDEFLADKPELAKKFLAATAKGYEYAIENPDASAEILVKAVPELDGALVLESQRFLSKEYKAEKEHWGIIDGARWAAFFDWGYEKGIYTRKLGEKGFTNEFLPQ